MTRIAARGAALLSLLLITLAFLGPFLWVLIASVQPEASLSAAPTLTFSLDNFKAVLTWETIILPLINSIVISGSTAILTVLVAGLAAYPLSRYQLRYRRHFMLTLLFTTGLPVTAILVPVYAMFFRFNLYGSVPAMVLFLTASSLPFSIWMMKNFMDGVPISLEEAAWVDGAGWTQSLRAVVGPLMAPGIAVVAIFVFVGQWGNFFAPFVLLDTPEKQPAAVTIYTFFSQYGQVAYGQLAAFSVLYTAPAVVLYVAVNKYLAGSFNFAGSVKG
ncbi:putative integral membrane transport protein [[Actinomadura] parvosata subsp. kistnae]|uniref:Sugar ABC transporter permease n=2 Tax=Nonomuraea TaxID=83681 RepID=A0A1U9ZSH9_9ACTN|nr:MULTISPECIES: carbohydrate ABC transporter permease [unclassified Nonomuraea]AQZ60920.1 sugar ABC transporter permease [Nonomuraea sp. ATCC 55076]NJP92677.1 carbohydrate ABC transporter permease [Nonomuraea sp. FMUSA5-5]SPL90400.1 putative integral membrane transport protein [Actinomadura parvosata subsp. kistnae]